MSSLYDRKRLDRAFTIGIIALVGFIVPIIGLVMGLIALEMTNSIEVDGHMMAKRHTNIIIIAWVAIALSVGAGAGYYYLYQKQQQNVRANAAAVQKAEQDEKQKAENDASAIQFLLNDCLNKVNDWYSNNSTGYHLQSYWDSLLASKQQQIQECQIRYN